MESVRQVFSYTAKGRQNMEQRLAEKRVVKRKYCFGFWMGEIIACLYANGNDPTEREM